MSLLSFQKKRNIVCSCISLLVLSSVAPLTGCDLSLNHDKIDRTLNADRQDYRDGLAPRDLEFEKFSSENDGVPPLEAYVATVSDDLRPMPIVSISVNQDIPLKNVLHELATQADYDVELDPRITGSVIFTARNRPFDMVIKRISEIAGLRYSFEDDILRVELDMPYTKTYKINYLSVVRSSNGSVSTNISVVTGDGADTGSDFNITSESENDFWGEIDENINQILSSNAGNGSLKTDEDPALTVVSANPTAPVVAVNPVDESAVTGDAPAPIPGQDQSTPPTVSPPTVTLQVASLPANNSSGPNDVDFEPAFSLNKTAGLVSVYANERMHDEVASYLDDLEKSVTSQVLIEAKILEVTLNDEYANGINWSAVGSGEFSIGFSNGTASARPSLSGIASNNFFVDYTKGDISAIVDSISRFGSVNALASPRLTVLNNQPAALNVAQNTVYFELDVNVTQATINTPGSVDVDSDIRNVPEGVLINVLPTLDLEKNSITMQVRPTVTRIVNRVEDPAVQFAGVPGVSSTIPEINVQEMDSVLTMRSGEVAILGGLLQDRTNSEQESIPVLGEIPILGNLFRTQGDQANKTELVIFIKATILKNASQSIHQTDKELYKTFANDRRPFKM